MEFVARPGRRPLQVESLAQPSEGATSRFVERLSFPHDRLKAVGQKRTNRPAFFGGDYARFTEQISVEFERDVRFHFVTIV
jgi:hypothetical protein